MKGWWKMIIFHFKHSYLNWRAIPYRRRMNCFYCNLFFNIFEFGLLGSHLDSIEILKCIIWQSNFFFCLFFVFISFLLWTTTQAIGGLSDWSITSHERIVLKGVIFWSKGCSCHFCPKKGLWLKSVPEKS